jgi:TDG/mug DNA glycosylase family protein
MDAEKKRSPLGPVVDKQTRVLILGSMPGLMSIKERQYYANPRNRFWTMIYAAFDAGRPAADYQERLSFLLERRIGLWDVAESCTRKGSSDPSIVEAVANDFDAFFSIYNNIEYIFFNGKRSAGLFRTLVPSGTASEKVLRTLPSSSPANTSRPAAEIEGIWIRTICEALE